MATIKEDYVSFEIAKLLKDKHFNGQYHMYYVEDGKYKCDDLCDIKDYAKSIVEFDYLHRTKVPATTLQMAMKWLREVHNIYVCIIPSEVGAGVMDYTYVLYKIDAKNFYFENLGIQGRAKNISEISYEEAVEAAIKYCLEHLI